MSLYHAFVALSKFKDIALPIAQPRTRDTSIGAPFGSLNPQTFLEGTLASLFPNQLWDYHLDMKLRTEWETKAVYKVFVTIKQLRQYDFSVDGGNYGYDPGDGFNDPAHPSWHDDSIALILNANDTISASIAYTDIDTSGTGIRNWTSAATGILGAFDAFQSNLLAPVFLREHDEVKVLHRVALNFRSIVESNLISESEPDPPVVFEGDGPPDPGLGNNGDFYQDLANHVTYGPKASSAWGAPQPFFVPAAKAYKHRAAQIRSGIEYSKGMGEATVDLHFFEDSDVKGAIFPKYQTPNLATDPVTTFPIPRPGDFRPAVGLIGPDNASGTINSYPAAGILVYLPLPLGLDNPMVNPGPLGVNSYFVSATAPDITLNHNWTDGDGRVQTAVFRAIHTGYRYNAGLG